LKIAPEDAIPLLKLEAKRGNTSARDILKQLESMKAAKLS
jgi:hypothetical protein